MKFMFDRATTSLEATSSSGGNRTNCSELIISQASNSIINSELIFISYVHFAYTMTSLNNKLYISKYSICTYKYAKWQEIIIFSTFMMLYISI